MFDIKGQRTLEAYCCRISQVRHLPSQLGVLIGALSLFASLLGSRSSLFVPHITTTTSESCPLGLQRFTLANALLPGMPGRPPKSSMSQRKRSREQHIAAQAGCHLSSFRDTVPFWAPRYPKAWPPSAGTLEGLPQQQGTSMTFHFICDYFTHGSTLSHVVFTFIQKIELI